MATAVKKIKTSRDLKNPDLARVIINRSREAIYFTRSIIPYMRDENDQNQWIHSHVYYKHIGIYAYRKEILTKLSQLPEGKLEKAENLEQLRAIEFGIKIYTIETDYEMICVDTPDDLARINEYVNLNKLKVDKFDERM